MGIFTTKRGDARKGHFVVYIGQEEKRFFVPLSYLKHSLFQEQLRHAEEEFGVDQPSGRLRLPCSEATFLTVLSKLQGFWELGSSEGSPFSKFFDSYISN